MACAAAEQENSFDARDWVDHPFQPFLIARRRHTAYMKWFAYKYIEIMVGMGDFYFRKFTLESISLAIQCTISHFLVVPLFLPLTRYMNKLIANDSSLRSLLGYVEAAHIFGPPPQSIMSVGKREPQTYNTVAVPEDQWDEFSNVLVNMETLFPFRNEGGGAAPVGSARVNVFGTSSGNYFCVPANPALVDLRGLIDDRLYKIRHCQDIDGNVRQLALWELPLDPGSLVAGAGTGASAGSVGDRVSPSSLPNYRFQPLLRLALELCSEVKTLGSNLLGLHERRDAELLSRLRLEHQKATGNRLLDLRSSELQEAQKVLEYYQGNREAVRARMMYYLDLLGEDHSAIPEVDGTFKELPYKFDEKASGTEAALSNVLDPGLPLSRYERTEIELSTAGMVFNTAAGVYDVLSGALGVLPTITFEAAPMGVGEQTSFGGGELSSIPRAFSSLMRTIGDDFRWGSDNASRLAQLQRQTFERTLQANMAGQEITGIDSQIQAQNIRIEQAQKKLDLEQAALDQDQEMFNFLQSKYTSEELFTWSINSLQTLYYKTYNVAFDLAAQAEGAYRFERGLDATAPPAFVQGRGTAAATDCSLASSWAWASTACSRIIPSPRDTISSLLGPSPSAKSMPWP